VTAVSAKITGIQELTAHYRRVPRIVRKAVASSLSHWGRKIVSSIKRDTGLFNNDPHPDAGHLQRSLWTARKKGTGEAVQELGWGGRAVNYGPLLEWGTKKKSWDITPRGFRSDITFGRSGGKVALKFLQFQIGGKIFYARKVVHNWTTAQLRPHFGPWVDHWHRHIIQDLHNIPVRALEGSLG